MRKTLKHFIKEGYNKEASVYEEYRLPWIEGPLIHLESSILKGVLKDG